MLVVRKPTYPYIDFLVVDDMMSLLCGRPISWGTEPRINSCEFTKLNSLYLRISCHNIYLISHVHTIPLDRCAFLYALVIDGFMGFPSMFIQTIVDIYRSTSKSQKLFFPMYIYRILKFLGLSDFPPLKLVHITALVGATYLRQRQAHMKSVEPSTGSSKRSQAASTTAPTFGAMPAAEETFVNSTTAVNPSGGADDADPTVAPPLSLHAMMKSFMTTQVAHGQLLNELLTEVASLKADFMEYMSAFPPPSPFED